MTYVGMSRNAMGEFKTLVLAQNDEEARRKVNNKFRSWWGSDYREEDVQICAFADSRLI